MLRAADPASGYVRGEETDEAHGRSIQQGAR
jgi:hypothetical protein